jgi:voltage-gated potassium channel
LPVPASVPSKPTATAPRKPPHRFLILLIMELVLILAYPFTLGIGSSFDWFRLLAVLIFVAALYAALGRGRVTLVAFLLGLPAILIHLANVAGRVLAFQTASVILAIIFLVFVTRAFIWTVMTDATVTTDTLVGAVAAYLLIGITYGLGYGLLEKLIPGSFRNTVQPGRAMHSAEFIFFSFVTLTTVGYGDIIPWSGHARSLVILESVTGIMYPAVLIGRLIGLHISRRSSTP